MRSRAFAFACLVASFAFADNGCGFTALFNYDADEAIRVSLGGEEHSIEPYDVKFVELKP